ncbi:hypothetical protein KY334_01645 [Candidatus Woesearchaeota archaeon]|nr:hypothetical protein [Candidatus Woesearchaeota archaeon]
MVRKNNFGISMSKSTLIVLAILFSLSFVLAIPEFPVQIYGDVTGLEGVELTIRGPSFVNDVTTTISGSKIQESILINSDQIALNDPIDFKFVGYEKFTINYDGSGFVYVKIDASNLTITTNTCSNNAECDAGQICNSAGQCVDDPNYCSSNGDCPSGQICRYNACVDDSTGTTTRRGGGSRRDDGSTSPRDNAACITRWICTEFGPCIGGYKTRSCFKEFACNDTSVKPIERAVCEIPVVITPEPIVVEPEPVVREEYIPPPPAPEPEPVAEESSGIFMYIFIIIAILLIVALAYVYYDHLRHRLHEYHIDPRMDKYVKDTLAKGFKVEDIKIALVNAGWNEDQVNKYFYENPDLGEKVYIPPQKETPLRSAIRKNVQARPAKQPSSFIQKEDSFIPKEDQESLDKLANIANPLKEAIKIKPELKAYIDSTLEEGFSKKEIEKALLKKGWKKEEYEEYLFHA